MHHPDLDGDHADRVAVGCCRRDRRMADDAAAAGPVHDIDRNAQLLLHQAADDPRRRIGAAAGRPRHDHGDRPLRIGRRRGRAVAKRREKRAPRRWAEGAVVMIASLLRGGPSAPTLARRIADRASCANRRDPRPAPGVRIKRTAILARLRDGSISGGPVAVMTGAGPEATRLGARCWRAGQPRLGKGSDVRTSAVRPHRRRTRCSRDGQHGRGFDLSPGDSDFVARDVCVGPVSYPRCQRGVAAVCPQRRPCGRTRS